MSKKIFAILTVAGLSLLVLSGSILAQRNQDNQGDTHSGGMDMSHDNMSNMHSEVHEERPELEGVAPIVLNPAAGSDIGLVYEAFLSPQQEGGEEEDTPALIPPQFRSTTPSVPRNERTSRGHAVLEFTRDLSKAFVFLAIENVNVADINMLHLHCGRPGQLGPIIVDFSLAGSLQTYLSDNTLSLEITNEDIVAVTSQVQSPIDAFTLGCPIVPDLPTDKVRTIAGLAVIAGQNEIYFNLHTTGQTYFGDMRGQFYPLTTSLSAQ
ncbi:MAG TPA: CHRD domain-containing protein [Phototrophicaceae bacterium]|jgi:hypothetical protein|nr:CHRD domain-containing protein [Phototrophicaceae bacterium]